MSTTGTPRTARSARNTTPTVTTSRTNKTGTNLRNTTPHQLRNSIAHMQSRGDQEVGVFSSVPIYSANTVSNSAMLIAGAVNGDGTTNSSSTPNRFRGTLHRRPGDATGGYTTPARTGVRKPPQASGPIVRAAPAPVHEEEDGHLSVSTPTIVNQQQQELRLLEQQKHNDLKQPFLGLAPHVSPRRNAAGQKGGAVDVSAVTGATTAAEAEATSEEAAPTQPPATPPSSHTSHADHHSRTQYQHPTKIMTTATNPSRPDGSGAASTADMRRIGVVMQRSTKGTNEPATPGASSAGGAAAPAPTAATEEQLAGTADFGATANGNAAGGNSGSFTPKPSMTPAAAGGQAAAGAATAAAPPVNTAATVGGTSASSIAPTPPVSVRRSVPGTISQNVHRATPNRAGSTARSFPRGRTARAGTPRTTVNGDESTARAITPTLNRIGAPATTSHADETNLLRNITPASHAAEDDVMMQLTRLNYGQNLSTLAAAQQAVAPVVSKPNAPPPTTLNTDLNDLSTESHSPRSISARAVTPKSRYVRLQEAAVKHEQDQKAAAAAAAIEAARQAELRIEAEKQRQAELQALKEAEEAAAADEEQQQGVQTGFIKMSRARPQPAGPPRDASVSPSAPGEARTDAPDLRTTSAPRIKESPSQGPPSEKASVTRSNKGRSASTVGSGYLDVGTGGTDNVSFSENSLAAAEDVEQTRIDDDERHQRYENRAPALRLGIASPTRHTRWLDELEMWLRREQLPYAEWCALLPAEKELFFTRWRLSQHQRIGILDLEKELQQQQTAELGAGVPVGKSLMAPSVKTRPVREVV